MHILTIRKGNFVKIKETPQNKIFTDNTQAPIKCFAYPPIVHESLIVEDGYLNFLLTVWFIKYLTDVSKTCNVQIKGAISERFDEKRSTSE